MNKRKMLLTGAAGRMGLAIDALASQYGFSVAVAADRADGFVDTLDDIPFDTLAVCVDFSAPEFLMQMLPYLAKHRIPLVSGTTGLTDAQMGHLTEISHTIPVFYATNMSRGVAVLRRLVQEATALLPQWDIELTEAHHHNKKDAPSGTAKTLLDDIQSIRKDVVLQHGREGLVGARNVREIGVHSVRGGDIVGEHSLLFAGVGERIEITHKAGNRTLFAHGALDAARWLLMQSSGLYSMDDLIM